MMKNSDMPAMPSKISVNRDTDQPDPYQFDNNGFVAPGLSKREHFAAMAMQGIAANRMLVDDAGSGNWVARQALSYADALLAALEADDE